MAEFNWPAGAAVSIAAVGTNGITAPTSSMEVAGINPSGNLQPLAVDAAGNVGMQTPADFSVSGTISALNGTVSLTGVHGVSEGLFVVTGTWVGSLNAQGSLDGTTWDNLTMFQGGVWSTAAVTANGNFRFTGVSGYTRLRVTASAYTSGTVSVTINATSGMNIINVKQGTASNLLATVTQGPAGAALWKVDGSGVTQPISAVALPLPTGAATETTLAALNTKVPAQGQAAMTGSMPVVIANNQSSVPTTDATLDQYITGAGPATAVINTNILLATTGTGATDFQGYRSIAFQVVTAVSTTAVAVNFEASNDNVNFIAVGMYDKTTPTAAPVTTFTTAASTVRYFEGPIQFRYFRVRLVSAIVAGSVQAFTIARISTYSPSNNSLAAGTQTIGSLAANQSSNVAQINAVAPLMGNGVTGTGSLRVTIASDNTSNTNAFLVAQKGRTKANTSVYNIYSSTPVTTSAYVQVVASTTSAIAWIDIFDSSGQAMILATGAAASEVDQLYIPPGGGSFAITIAASTRLTLKALTANTGSSGYFLMDMWG